jgi:hypothetical protein
MAITRAKQAKQMLRNGGMSLQEAKDMAPKGEFLAYINNKEANMLKKAGGSGIMTKAGIPSFVEYGGRDAFEGAKSTGSVQGDVDRGRGDGPNPVDEVALVTGPKTKTKTKTKDKNNILDIFNPLSKKRKKFAYNLSMLTPGQIERSKKMQTAYKNYLESMGVSIPSTLTGEEDDLAEFFVEDAFKKPVQEDAMLETPQSYGEFIAENFGAPGVMMSGNVGGLEKFVKTRNPDGSPATFGYRNVSDRGDPSILFPQGIMAQAPSITEQEPEEEGGLRLAFRANGGRIGFRGGDAARSDAASGRDAGRADPSGGVERGGSNRDRRRVEQYTKPPTFVGGGGGEEPKPFLVADALTTPTAGQFGFNLMELKRLKDAGYDPEEVSEGGYGADLLKALQPITLAKGGIADTVVGGEMDFESARQMYGLGKLVKKVTRTVKKIAKSPIGKAAILGAGFGLAGMGPFKGLANTPFGTGLTKNFLKFKGTPLGETIFGKAIGDTDMTRTGGLLGLIKDNPVISGITAASVAAGLLTPEQEEEAQALADSTGFSIEEARNSILARARDDYKMDFRARGFRAEGGIMRAGYQEGSKEPVAKKTMPLLDMDGKEMDLREEGGFVPIGRMEKADDVPARLSKNEFVFTADAVRNAGEGDVDKGAEVMYNMMKNLEAGGEVSEESQGMDGARRMFQTSQRLEEVL